MLPRKYGLAIGTIEVECTTGIGGGVDSFFAEEEK
jgi:hypothetical protein